MLIYLFLVVTFYIILMMFLTLYFYFKVQNALQAYQQSAYNEKRFLRYIKNNYKYSFGINELLLLIIFLLTINVTIYNPIWYLLKYFLLIFFSYYNLKFFNMSKKRYVKKLKLKITNRVKRLLVTFTILNVIFLAILTFIFNIFVGIIIMIYITYIMIILSGVVNIPVEKYVRAKFKNRAKIKLEQFKDLTVIGVTGSYGKTSIKNIIFDVLSDSQITLKTPASYNTPMGVCITIDKELNKMYDNFIVEMGAYYPGEIKELTDMVHPKIGVVASIGPQHLETFKTIKKVQSTKMELIEGLPTDGLGVLNYDNEYIKNYKIKNDVKIKWYSLEEENVDLYAYDIVYLDSGMEFKIKFKGMNLQLKTKLLGKHSIYNILASILVADFQQIDLKKIIRSIESIKPIKSRLEFKRVNKDFIIIDDSFNGNVEGMIEGINILKKYDNKKILITPGIIDGGDQNYELNKTVAKNIEGIDLAIIIGKYNKDALVDNIKKDVVVKTFDNFIDGYNYVASLRESKTLLIANDLPDKYN